MVSGTAQPVNPGSASKHFVPSGERSRYHLGPLRNVSATAACRKDIRMLDETGWVFPLRILDFDAEVFVSIDGSGQPSKIAEKTWTDGRTTLKLETESLAEDAVVLRMRITAPSEFTLGKIGVRCRIPAVEVHRQFLATSPHRNRAAYASYMWHIDEASSACNGIPFILCHCRTGANTFFMGFVDQPMDTRIEHHSTHADRSGGIQTTLFALSRPLEWAKITGSSYGDAVYISRQRKHYTQVLREYVEFVEKESRMGTAAVPAHCYAPVWCTWYAFLGGPIDHDRVVANARVAAELGVGTILIDAGWFIPEPSNEPGNRLGNMAARADRFPDMKQTFAEIRGLGMKAMLWTGPLFWRGTRGNPAFEELRVRHRHDGGQAYLCPRVEESHLAASLMISDVMRRYEPDGLKIDFIDIGSPECIADHEHAYATVGESMDVFLSRMHQAIVSVKPDALIEYRTNYANINNKRYANCFRINDAPYDFDQIRRGVAIIKPWAQPIPVHADYIYWDPREELTTKAIAMASVVFGCVPTLSIDLVCASKEELAMIKAWLAFYNERRRELVDGRHVPLAFDPHYSVARITAGNATYFGLFSEICPAFLEMEDAASGCIFLINGSGGGKLYTNITGIRGGFGARVLDLFHRPAGEFTVKARDDALRVECDVPQGGLVRLDRIS